ncbi:hypothetical protein JL722_6088 [Aureococcus anophagefferens]|nr:hypothetical protein JL722_6088 [Aureococcus anophagefferens]
MSCSHVVVAEVERGDFGNRGKDGDWTARNEALLALQRLFDEAARLEPPNDRDAEPAFDAEAWRALRLPLQSSLKDLRSQLVREACALLVCIARACNDGAARRYARRAAARGASAAVPTLLELLSSGNRLNARFVDDCLLAIIARCRFKQFVAAVASTRRRRGGKSAAVREACATYASEIVQQWGVAYLGKHDDAVRLLQSTIAALVEDSSERARASARAFAEFARGGPSSPTTPEPSPPPSPERDAETGFDLGDRVRVQKSRAGTVRFAGATHFSSGAWIGVELDAVDGKHDGVVNGRRYFQCDAARGLFVRPSHVAKLAPDDAAAPELPLANALCCEHKHLLKGLMTTLQAQLEAIGDFEASAITRDSARRYADVAEFAAPPLVELLSDYELRVAELRHKAARDAPPASPTRAINIELTRVHDDDPNSPVDGTDLVGEHKDVDVEVDLPTPEKPDDDDDAGGDRCASF